MRNVFLALLTFYLSFGLQTLSGKSRIATVPFKMLGTYMVLEVQFNGSSKLNMILDSGASATLITELTQEDSLTLHYSSEVEIKGLGSGQGVMAYCSHLNELKAGKIRLNNQTIYVLKNNSFNLSNHAGTKINGILGSDFFANNLVKINYDTQTITLFENEGYQIPKGYEPISMTLDKKKMYVTLPVIGADWKVHNALLLLDTGAEVTAWFRSFGEDHIPIPDKRIHRYIGEGLNGIIEGQIGQINQISIRNHILSKPVVAFPDSSSISEILSTSDRDGILGGQLLYRFNLIFDYPNKTLWIKKNSNFNKPFGYNITGLELLLENKFLALPEVCNVGKNSPAERAGIKVGDQIFQVNNQNTLKIKINDIRRIFETPSRRPLELILLRKDSTIHAKIEMLDLLK